MTGERDRYEGLAFPVAVVRFAGPTDHRGSRYLAVIRQGERVTRSTRSYRHDESASQNAHAAARLCWEKHRAQLAADFRRDGLAWTDADDEQTRTSVLVPGDLDRDSYAFVIVPAYAIGAGS